MTALKIDLVGDGAAIVTRHFAASPEQVFRAHVEAEYIRQWMGGMEGWDMTHCESDARAGGVLRYGWAGPDGMSFEITGEYEVVKPYSEIAMSNGCTSQRRPQTTAAIRRLKPKKAAPF